MEDYSQPFTCHAGVSAAHFTLKPPGNVPVGEVLLRGLKWWQGHTRKTSGMKCKREAAGWWDTDKPSMRSRVSLRRLSRLCDSSVGYVGSAI